MNSKEIVRRAIEFDHPPRVPILYFNQNMERSDVFSVGYRPPAGFQSVDPLRSEWGFVWERLDDTMGQPGQRPITDWAVLDNYVVPDARAPGRFDHLPQFIEEHRDKYLIGGLGISGFNFMTFLRGFEDTLADFYCDRDQIERLAEIVFSFELDIIRQYGNYELDAISFADDWGTQQSLMISPELWRSMFKPRYKHQFELVHAQGMHVYFHCCGNIRDIIPDLIEIGADVLNLNQPDLFGIENLGREFGGKVCFNCPVDHQTVAITGTEDEIHEYVRRLNANLGMYNGGYIGYIEAYQSIGMSDLTYQHIVDAFEALNR